MKLLCFTSITKLYKRKRYAYFFFSSAIGAKLMTRKKKKRVHGILFSTSRFLCAVVTDFFFPEKRQTQSNIHERRRKVPLNKRFPNKLSLLRLNISCISPLSYLRVSLPPRVCVLPFLRPPTNPTGES